METIRLAIIDDEELFRKGIRMMLEKAEGFDIVFEGASGEALINWLHQQEVLPDIILLDIKMPELNGIEVAKLVKGRFSNLKIVALSSYYSEAYIYNMLHNGAAAFLSKNCDIETMLHTIREVYKKGFFYSDELLQHINRVFSAQPSRMKTELDKGLITKRELEILVLICKQLTTSEIAKEMYISPRTVDGHRNNLLLKTGAKNMISLVIFALENNIVTIGDIKNTF